MQAEVREVWGRRGGAHSRCPGAAILGLPGLQNYPGRQQKPIYACACNALSQDPVAVVAPMEGPGMMAGRQFQHMLLLLGFFNLYSMT